MKQQVSIGSESQVASYDANPTLIATSLAIFLTSFMTSGMNVAIPFIGHEFNADAITLGWVVNAFLLVLCVFLVPFGRLADIIGLKKIFIWGVILFTAISAVTFFSNSIIMLIIFRSLQGISCAMVFSTAMALTTATHPSNKRGRALGVNVSFVYIGYSVYRRNADRTPGLEKHVCSDYSAGPIGNFTHIMENKGRMVPIQRRKV